MHRVQVITKKKSTIETIKELEIFLGFFGTQPNSFQALFKLRKSPISTSEERNFRTSKHSFSLPKVLSYVIQSLPYKTKDFLILETNMWQLSAFKLCMRSIRQQQTRKKRRKYNPWKFMATVCGSCSILQFKRRKHQKD